MELKALRAFCGVADCGSFSRAAAALGVAQSVLSRQVSALEVELGARLFYRSGRGAIPTEIGEAVRPRAKSLLADSEQLLLEARGVRDHPAGDVDLGVIPALTPLVGHLAERLRRDYPLIRLRVYESYSGQIEDWLASGRVEVGFLNRFRAGKVRGAEKVLQSELMVVSPRGHAATRQGEIPFRALGELPLALPVRPTPLGSLLADLAARHGIQLNIVLEGSTATIIMDAVARSGLCTVLPRHYVQRHLQSRDFSAARIVKPVIAQTTWLAVGTQRPASIAARLVARLVREIMLEQEGAKSKK